MTDISKVILNNLQLKAGDLNEPGKLIKLFSAYEDILDKLVVHADNLSKNYKCGGCGKHRTTVVHEDVPSYTSEANLPELRPYSPTETETETETETKIYAKGEPGYILQ